MAKTAQTRLDETIGYIRRHAGDDLADELNKLTAGNMAISDDISLGAHFNPFQSTQASAADTQRRQAFRALLLCQRIYFSDL